MKSYVGIASAGTMVLLLALSAGCQPAATQRENINETRSPTVTKEQTDTTMKPAADESNASSPDAANSPSAGVHVDVGGGKGVDVDVNLPSSETKEGQSNGKSGVKVDVGDSGVDVRVGSARSDKKEE